ncbi:MAG TPA: iduronate-2-sulfatase [bacterium]|nr:iduronate-2-sulfatase [bacterium]
MKLTRREFISALGIGAVGSSLGSCRLSKQIEQPNVLFIAIDDLNDWSTVLGGHPQAITPNLERLARRSVTFTNAYTAAAACNASRTSLMTGLPPYKTGIYENWVPWRKYIPEAVTIPQYFTKHGYWSAGAGKIFHNSFPDPLSWEDYFPSKTKHFPPYIYPDNRPANMPYYGDMYRDFDWWGHDRPDEDTGDFKSVQWIGEQLQKSHDHPFFLACGLYRPHLPWFVPKKYFEMFPLETVKLPEILENDLEDLPEAALQLIQRQKIKYHDRVIKHDKWKEAVQAYLASITYADAMLGRLLDFLDSSPYVNNTVIVLWSDHGWQLGEKTHWRKYALWENIAKVHFMMSAPKGAPGLPKGARKGTRCRRAVSLQDIYPTLLDLCGLPAREDIGGHSLAPLLGKPDMRWDHPAITSVFTGDLAVSWENWRYISYGDGGEELYNLESDPHEWKNLADDLGFADIKKRMRAMLPKNPAAKVQRGSTP